MDIDYTVGEVELSYKPKFKSLHQVTCSEVLGLSGLLIERGRDIIKLVSFLYFYQPIKHSTLWI